MIVIRKIAAAQTSRCMQSRRALSQRCFRLMCLYDRGADTALVEAHWATSALCNYCAHAARPDSRVFNVFIYM